MSLKIHLPPGLQMQVIGGERKDDVAQFGDDVERITIGRDAAKCNVVFPASETKVGREHCALKRELGRYQIALNREDVVLINGRSAIYGQDLESPVSLQLGRSGPTLKIETELNQTLPGTEMRERQPGQLTVVREVKQQASLARKLAVAALILVAVVGVVGYSQIGKQQRFTADQQKRVDQLSARFAKIQADQKKLQQALDKARESVYLVLDRDAKGHEFASGTAWVVDQAHGILATNAHMVEIFQTMNLNEDDLGHTLVLRSTANPPRDFVVQSIKKHPGFDASDDLSRQYVPVRQISEVNDEVITLPDFCDIGLYIVKDPQGLGPALPLADIDTLKKLEPAIMVGLIGYPMEDLSMGGVNTVEPTPTVQVGHIIAMTNYFESQDVDFADRLLVEHSVPTAGGASGSPILNSDGFVVAVHNAGNYVGTINSLRLGSTAMKNFAQRVDLVQELLDNKADALQPARTKLWTDEIGHYYQKKSDVVVSVKSGQAEDNDLRDKILDESADSWRKNLSADFATDSNDPILLAHDSANNIVKTNELTGSTTEVSYDYNVKLYQHTSAVHLSGTGQLYAGVAGHLVDFITLDVCRGIGKDLQHPALMNAVGGVPDGRFRRNPWLATLLLDITEPGDYTIRAFTSNPAELTQHAEFVLKKATTPDTPPPTPLAPLPPSPWQSLGTSPDSLVATWIFGHADWKGRQPKLIWQGTVNLNNVSSGNWAATQLIPASLDAGDYLGIAHASDDELLALELSSGTPSPFFTVIPDISKTWPLCPLSLAAASSNAEFTVVGSHQGAEVSLYIYKAAQP